MNSIDPGSPINELATNGLVKAIGCDLLTLSRIEATLERTPERFAERVLTPQEYEIWLAKKSSAAYLAKRWAGKEAISKALGTGIAKGVSFQHMEILSDANGKPVVTLSARAAEVAAELGASTALLSLSDERDQILAFAALI